MRWLLTGEEDAGFASGGCEGDAGSTSDGREGDAGFASGGYEGDAGLTPDERDLLDSYRRLDDRDRQDVVGLIAVKLERYGQREKALA
jgi:hypothetical protein